MGQGVLKSLLADAGLRDDPALGLMMGEVPLADIAERAGTPTYAYHATVIRERYAALDAAFGTLPHRICYAVKANGNLAVLRLLARLGAGADIVSGGELLRAIAAGFPPDRIVFSGVGKTDEELLAALTVGVGHINVESLAELRRLAILAELQGVQVTVGVRINPDVTADTHPYISTGTGGLKFGIATDQFTDALAILDDASHLTLGAIAMHLGSQITDAKPWVAGLERLLMLLDVARDAGHSPNTLDIGGGLGIRYHDESPLAPADWIAPLAKMIAASGSTVQVEPGRYLVGAAGVLLTSVVHRKASGGREIAVVDAGMNDLLRPSLYRAWHEIVPVKQTPGAVLDTDIVGPVCETGDFLALARPLAPVAAGGVLAVLGAGAYAFAMSSNYNSRARAAEVLVEGNRWAVVRPRERLVDLYRDELADPFALTEAP
ncbi:MAG: diaminopimelate decarboxylase [Gemmatimonadales bacterium]|nr:diaminopimelate decarboxylase [Gemmatimonadales bacterium]MDZ4390595.1 diaminopimelate decarboxylase [Gemmatimonadales bacterium]